MCWSATRLTGHCQDVSAWCQSPEQEYSICCFVSWQYMEIDKKLIKLVINKLFEHFIEIVMELLTIWFDILTDFKLMFILL